MPEENTSMPSTSGSKNKMWYIIGGIIVLVLIGWFFTRGSGMMGVRAIGGASGADVRTNMDGSTTYSNEEGKVTVGGNKLPDNWPSDVPGTYGGGTIQYAGSSNPQTGAAGSAVVYTVRASAQSVIDYYKGELTKSGWKVEASANMGAATVLSAKKDARTIGVYVADTGDGSVSVTVGIEM